MSATGQLAMTTAVLVMVIAVIAALGVIVWLLLGWRVGKPEAEVDPAVDSVAGTTMPILNTDTSGQAQLRLPERSTPVQLPPLISRIGPAMYPNSSPPVDRGPHPAYGQHAQLGDDPGGWSPGESDENRSDSEAG